MKTMLISITFLLMLLASLVVTQPVQAQRYVDPYMGACVQYVQPNFGYARYHSAPIWTPRPPVSPASPPFGGPDCPPIRYIA